MASSARRPRTPTRREPPATQDERTHITAAEYQQLAAGKTKAHGSKRGTQGTSVGTCRVCGQHVGHADPAWFHVDLHADGREERWVEHKACHRRVM